MRLSELILLGSTMLKLKPRAYLCEDGGCLIGMGLYAAGHRFDTLSIEAIDASFPWLDTIVPVPLIVNRLTYHGPFDSVPGSNEIRVKIIIGCMAYMVKHGDITLEEAVDWIRQNEPPEPPEPVDSPLLPVSTHEKILLET